MLKVLIQSWSLAAMALLLVSSSANAAPALYSFDSGSAVLSVTLDDGSGTNALMGGGVINVTLDGEQVVYDSLATLYGTLLSLELTAAGPIFIDLDDANPDIATDTLTINNAILSSAVGSTGVLTDLGSFFIDTALEGTVTGVLSTTTPIGPFQSMSLSITPERRTSSSKRTSPSSALSSRNPARRSSWDSGYWGSVQRSAPAEVERHKIAETMSGRFRRERSWAPRRLVDCRAEKV